jgi:ribosome-associated protein
VSRIPTTLRIGPRLSIPGREISLKAVRSGGPGGQHVNKTASRIELRWNLETSEAPTDEDRAWLRRRLASRLTTDGELVLHADRHRDQRSNVEDALDRFVDVLAQALARPKRRKPTRPTRGSKERRLEGKRRQSARKRDRKAPDG